MHTTTPSSATSLDPHEVSQPERAGIERLKTTAHDAVERAAAAASSAADSLSARSGDLIAAKREWMDTARGYVRDHPLAALGIAIAAGYVLTRFTGR
jgi:ElaB/YqjD/DUF883 family membrane-anchored ribosome-binding protein